MFSKTSQERQLQLQNELQQKNHQRLFKLLQKSEKKIVKINKCLSM